MSSSNTTPNPSDTTPDVSFDVMLADLVEKAVANDVKDAAALIVLSRPFQDRWVGDSDSTAAYQRRQEVVKAFNVLTDDLKETSGSALLMKPAGSFQADALRAELPHPECLNALTEPLVKGKDPLVATEWNFLGALTLLQKNTPPLDLLHQLAAHEPEAFSTLRDPKALRIELAALEEGPVARGVHEPVNQWLPAFKDGGGKQHDVMDLAVLLSGHEKLHIPAVLAHHHANDPSGLGGALALHALRAHDVLARHGEKNLALSVPGETGAHVDHVVATALAFGAAQHLSQQKWEDHPSAEKNGGRGLRAESAEQSTAGVPGTSVQPLSTALLRNVAMLGDHDLARGISSLHKNGHDVVMPDSERAPSLKSFARDLPQTLGVVLATEASAWLDSAQPKVKLETPSPFGMPGR